MPPPGLQIWHRGTLTFDLWCAGCVATQLAFPVICACWVWSKFVRQLLRSPRGPRQGFVWPTSEPRDLDLSLPDLKSQKSTVSYPCPVDHLRQFAAKSVHTFSKYRLYNMFTIWQRTLRVRTNGQTDERTNGQSKNIRPLWPRDLRQNNSSRITCCRFRSTS